MRRLGVALLGPAAFVREHRVLLDTIPEAEAVGCWCGNATSPSESPLARLFSGPDDLLSCDAVQVVVVGAPVAERAYWCQRVLASGKALAAEVPLGDRVADVERVVASSRNTPATLAVVDASRCGAVAEGLAAARQTTGPIVFVNLDIQVPRMLLGRHADGVLLTAAAGYLARIHRLVGELDSIWAATRSLVRLCRNEDVATAYLRAQNGVEGLVHVGGVNTLHHVRVSVSGESGALTWSDVLPVVHRQAWVNTYARLVACAAEDTDANNTEDKLLLDDLLTGHRWVEWIQRAARSNRELTWKEAQNG